MATRVNNVQKDSIKWQKHVRRTYPRTVPETDGNSRKQLKLAKFRACLGTLNQA